MSWVAEASNFKRFIFRILGPQIASLERNLTMQLESIGSTDIEGLETFLIQQENLLHPNHASIVSAKNMIAVG